MFFIIGYNVLKLFIFYIITFFSLVIFYFILIDIFPIIVSLYLLFLISETVELIAFYPYIANFYKFYFTTQYLEHSYFQVWKISWLKTSVESFNYLVEYYKKWLKFQETVQTLDKLLTFLTNSWDFQSMVQTSTILR